MELWFSENHTPNVKLSLRVNKQLYSHQSECQHTAEFRCVKIGRASCRERV